ncbi:hypothetical protein G7Y89_g4538 [Cudoniella acicularis]|uniref:Uncharacterized protein n=1 Tax=Cudoniella acicularis TaxID=354080 RepID=A0A8H4W7C8_9HELO|nr:hypothetical protein G7Y89_g4538 [Cudoniella acicularis]
MKPTASKVFENSAITLSANPTIPTTLLRLTGTPAPESVIKAIATPATSSASLSPTSPPTKEGKINTEGILLLTFTGILFIGLGLAMFFPWCLRRRRAKKEAKETQTPLTRIPILRTEPLNTNIDPPPPVRTCKIYPPPLGGRPSIPQGFPSGTPITVEISEEEYQAGARLGPNGERALPPGVVEERPLTSRAPKNLHELLHPDDAAAPKIKYPPGWSDEHGAHRGPAPYPGWTYGLLGTSHIRPYQGQ